MNITQYSQPRRTQDFAQQFYGQRILKKNRCIQVGDSSSNNESQEHCNVTPASLIKTKDQQIQVSPMLPNYQSRRRQDGSMTYRQLLLNVICTRECLLLWLRQHKLIQEGFLCPTCQKPMHQVPAYDRTDGIVWLCRVQGQCI